MGIGVVSDDEFLAELESVSRPPTSKPIVIQNSTPGRSQGDVNVPTSIQSIIGETSHIDGRQEALALADKFGISPSSVSAYTNGASSTASYNDTKKGIANPIAKARARIARKSRNVMIQAIDSITEAKLTNAKATDLASIAKDLAGVVRVMESSDGPQLNEGTKPAIIIFTPAMRREDSFEVIDVSSREAEL